MSSSGQLVHLYRYYKAAASPEEARLMESYTTRIGGWSVLGTAVGCMFSWGVLALSRGKLGCAFPRWVPIFSYSSFGAAGALIPPAVLIPKFDEDVLRLSPQSRLRRVRSSAVSVGNCSMWCPHSTQVTVSIFVRPCAGHVA
jgi:hypothetical protein